jgi:hypothetical protein
MHIEFQKVRQEDPNTLWHFSYINHLRGRKQLLQAGIEVKALNTKSVYTLYYLPVLLLQ